MIQISSDIFFSLFTGNARKKDKYKRMKQQEVKKELKLKAAKSGGKVTPVTGKDEFFLLNNLNSACSPIIF